MRHSAEQRKRIRAAFVEAKKWLRTGQETRNDEEKTDYICVALNECEDVLAQGWAKSIIDERLGFQAAGAGSWLLMNVPDARHYRETHSYYEWFRQVQAYRHRWVDALIEEFSK